MSVVLDAVSASIGDALVVDAVSADARDGEVTGLLGPNGAGKSTLLRVIAGIARPVSGRVFLDGEPVQPMDRRTVARRIALLEQSAELSGDLRVLDVVVLGRFPHRRGLFGSFDGPDDRAIARAALERVGAVEFADRSWNALSGGERQRVHVARALAQQPEVLLLDEPTNHLDVSAQLATLAQVRGLGLTTVVALHDLNLAAAYCDRLLVLHHGRLVAQGTPADVLTPGLIREVYGSESRVLQHPRHGGPLVVYDMPGAVGSPLVDAAPATDNLDGRQTDAAPSATEATPAANPSA